MECNTQRAVLFDMDGVLVDSYEAWFRLINTASEELGYSPITREQFKEIWGQGPDLDVELIFTRHTVEEVEGYYNQHFRDFREYVRANPSAKKVFQTLHDKRIGIGVITNTPSPIAREVLRYAELHPDVLVGGTDVPRGKPAPDMVFKALGALGVSNEHALLVGDSHYDEEAASAAEVHFIQYDIKNDERLDAALGDLA